MMMNFLPSFITMVHAWLKLSCSFSLVLFLLHVPNFLVFVSDLIISNILACFVGYTYECTIG